MTNPFQDHKENSDILDVITRGIKKRNATGKALCEMCGNKLATDYDCNVCKECLGSSFPTEQEELEYRIKHKLCDKCGGQGNVCSEIRNHSVCGLCRMEGFK